MRTATDGWFGISTADLAPGGDRVEMSTASGPSTPPAASVDTISAAAIGATVRQPAPFSLPFVSDLSDFGQVGRPLHRWRRMVTTPLLTKGSMPTLLGRYSQEGTESLARFVSMTLRDGVVIQRAGGEIIWFNSVACRLLRMEPEQLLGSSSLDPSWAAIHADGSPFPGEEHPAVHAVETGEAVLDVLMGVRVGDLQMRWLLVDSHPVEIDGERLAVTIFSDVTAEREDRRALESTVLEIQRMLLQEEFPDNDLVRFSARYRSVGLSTKLGGDFYGAYEYNERRCGFFIGDVCGHGVGSASLSSLARNSVRAVSAVLDNPSLVLRELHRVLLLERPDMFLTAISGYVEQTPSRLLLRLAVGGHPLPILVRHGQATLVGTAGQLVGMLPDSMRPVYECELQPGDRLIAYTDGLLDCAPGRLTSEQLLEAVPLEAPLDDILDALLSLGTVSRDAPDDTALIGFEVV